MVSKIAWVAGWTWVVYVCLANGLDILRMFTPIIFGYCAALWCGSKVWMKLCISIKFHEKTQRNVNFILICSVQLQNSFFARDNVHLEAFFHWVTWELFFFQFSLSQLFSSPHKQTALWLSEIGSARTTPKSVFFGVGGGGTEHTEQQGSVLFVFVLSFSYLSNKGFLCVCGNSCDLVENELTSLTCLVEIDEKHRKLSLRREPQGRASSQGSSASKATRNMKPAEELLTESLTGSWQINHISAGCFESLWWPQAFCRRSSSSESRIPVEPGPTNCLTAFCVTHGSKWCTTNGFRAEMRIPAPQARNACCLVFVEGSAAYFVLSFCVGVFPWLRCAHYVNNTECEFSFGLLVPRLHLRTVNSKVFLFFTPKYSPYFGLPDTFNGKWYATCFSFVRQTRIHKRPGPCCETSGNTWYNYSAAVIMRCLSEHTQGKLNQIRCINEQTRRTSENHPPIIEKEWKINFQCLLTGMGRWNTWTCWDSITIQLSTKILRFYLTWIYENSRAKKSCKTYVYMKNDVACWFSSCQPVLFLPAWGLCCLHVVAKRGLVKYEYGDNSKAWCRLNTLGWKITSF